MVSWAVIAITVAVIAAVNWQGSRQESRVKAVDDFQFLMEARLAVGQVRMISALKAASPKQTDDKASAAVVDQLIQQLSKAAKHRDEKLPLAIVIGEIKGSAAALAELDHSAAEVSKEKDSAGEKDDLKILRAIYADGPAGISSQQREQLLADQGWFGQLALSTGLPDTDPFRQKVLNKAQAAFGAVIVFGLVILLAALLGIIFFIVAGVRLAGHRVHICYRPPLVPTTAFLEAFALYLGGYVVIGLVIRALVPNQLFLGTIVSIAWIPFAMLWPLLRGQSWAQLKGGLGWYTGRGVLREALAGIAGYLAGLPIVIVGGIITVVLVSLTNSNATHPIVLSETKGFWPVVELFLLASVFAPLVEETMFRGALFNHLRQRSGWLLSAGLSAFIFAAIHPQGWTAIPVLGSIGFVFAGIREWRGSFFASAAAHATNNTVVLALLVLALR